MSDTFTENSYREVINSNSAISGNVVKKDNLTTNGQTKVEFHEEHDDSVKILLKKDENDQVQEIKFVCSCGETKSITLDYND